MPEDRITKSLDLIEGANDEELPQIVHEASEAMSDEEASVAACVDWANTAMLMTELTIALADQMADENEADVESHPN